jgi:MSHA pilin protein MshD
MCIDPRPAGAARRRQRGLTLIELIVFIVIVSVGLAGLLAALDVSVRGSADPMVHKQMLSIAEALLEEVELQPYCKSGDSNCANATGGTCGSGNRSGLGQVSDYNNCSLPSPIADASGTTAAPAGYSAQIAVTTPETLNGADVARITVTVCRSVTPSCGSADSVVVEGYRAHDWPNQDQPW